MNFSSDDNVIAIRHFLEVRPCDLLALPDGVHVGGVEESDTGFNGDLEMFPRVFLVDVPAFGAESPGGKLAAPVAHAAETKSRYGDTGLAEGRIFHRLHQ